jgi:cell division septation protein DedD
VVESPRETPRETPESEPARPSGPPPAKPITTAPQQPPETSKAAQPPPKSEPVKAEPPKTAKAEKGNPDRKGGAAPPASINTPSGTYLQLAATTKREADIMVDVLRQKKFQATTAQVPEKPDLFRVLVGPVAEAQVNKTKADLQSAGFPGDKSIKRTF